MATETAPVGGASRKQGDGRQARWQGHNQKRRQEILDAALRVIEAAGPGGEVQVQQIAEEAGIGRTVVYRHFDDRAELDQAIRVAIMDEVWGELVPALSLEGTVPEIVERVVAAYVRWAAAHPALHRMAEQQSGEATDGPLDQGLSQVADQVRSLIETALELLGLRLDPATRSAIDPLVFGLVGAVFGVVRRWLAREEPEPDAQTLVWLATESVWYLIAGHAHALGVELNRDQPVEELMASVLPAETEEEQ